MSDCATLEYFRIGLKRGAIGRLMRSPLPSPPPRRGEGTRSNPPTQKGFTPSPLVGEGWGEGEAPASKPYWSVSALIRPTLLLAAVLLLNGCGVGHLLHLAKGQADLLRQRRPVQEALQDARLSDAQRDKIRLILKVRAFGIEHLGLYDSATYTTFVHLDQPFVSYNLTASPVDAIEPYVWRYPFVGRMPYQGFFSQDGALAAQGELQQLGYDTYLRGVRAYSTLGYFADPILSSMLSYPDGALIETVLHEMLHQTVWIKGHVSFNESLASFVGQKGAEAYVTHHDGVDSPAHRDYLDRRADADLLRTHLQQLISRLQDLYQEPVSREEKLRRREALFDEAVATYPALFPRMKTHAYRRFFEGRTLNNALLLSFRVYNRETTFFDDALAAHDGDLRRTIAYFKTLRARDIPDAFRTP